MATDTHSDNCFQQESERLQAVGFNFFSSSSGFTLVELMVTVAIVALIAGFTFAELSSSSYKLKTAARSLKTSLQKARLEAIKRNVNVNVDFDHNQDGTPDNDGYLISDGNGNMIEKTVNPAIHITPPTGGTLTFTASGTSFTKIFTITPNGKNQPEYKITTHTTGNISLDKTK